MRIITGAAVVLLLAGTSIVHAAEAKSEITVNAGAAEVWDQVGPFCSISDWYPGITSCKEETRDGATHRRLETADGAVFLEKLLGHDDNKMTYSYAIIEGPLPVSNYSAVFHVTDAGGKALISWESTFEPVGVSEEEAVGVVTGVYDMGLGALRERFGN